MTKQLHYGTTAKSLHWAIVTLLVAQYAIGWLMPDVHAGPPGVPMIWHISIGMVILALILARFVWRLTHPVAPESSLPAWQRMTYGWSVLHCLPTQLAEQPSAATGTVMRADTLRQFAALAGFSDVEVLPVESDFFRLYRLHA